MKPHNDITLNNTTQVSGKLRNLCLVFGGALHFYRMRGYYRAYKAFKKLVDDMSASLLPEIRTLRRTLLKWQEEVLNYFLCRLTNARLEGFNCKASLLKRRAYGYRNPENYRIQLLNACS